MSLTRRDVRRIGSISRVCEEPFDGRAQERSDHEGMTFVLCESVFDGLIRGDQAIGERFDSCIGDDDVELGAVHEQRAHGRAGRERRDRRGSRRR